MKKCTGSYWQVGLRNMQNFINKIRVLQHLFLLTFHLEYFNIFLGNFIIVLQEFGSVGHVVALYQHLSPGLSVGGRMVTGPYGEVNLALVGELLWIDLKEIFGKCRRETLRHT